MGRTLQYKVNNTDGEYLYPTINTRTSSYNELMIDLFGESKIWLIEDLIKTIQLYSKMLNTDNQNYSDDHILEFIAAISLLIKYDLCEYNEYIISYD